MVVHHWRRGLLIGLALAGCGDDGLNTCLPGCPGTRAYDARAYTLHARFDWDQRVLVATEDVTLALTDPGTSAVVELDSAVQVSQVTAGGTVLAFVADEPARRLRVDLAPLGPSGDPVTFTVEYTAQVSDALIAASGRDGDPVGARVVFTDSEPDRGSSWLVARHDPADRALWAVELTVAADEDVIANGTRVRDDSVADGRRVRYELGKPIPTYLMAFAGGQLEHQSRAGRVPLAVWYRRGLLLEPDKTLDAVADAMATFETLVGPYPWDSYSVVLVPEYGGGMENATITFDLESSGQGNVSFGLNAHELAHHWFGDWVTVRTFDDLWFKEGMATLLQSEAQRARREAPGQGRLFGFDFGFDPADAVRDRSLTGLDRYTSGPYQRAAWLISQIRARVGDTAFWTALRGLLAAHPLDSIDSETFIRSFAPALDEASIQRLLATLDRKPVPAVTVASQLIGADTSVTLTLTDPSNAFIAPMGVTVVDAAGVATTRTLAAGTPLTVLVPSGGYLAPDEADVHPDWPTSFSIAGADYGRLTALYRPSAAPAQAALASRSAAQQERALVDGGLPPFAATELPGFYAQLGSVVARRYAELDACAVLQSLGGGGDTAGWSAALGPILQSPAIQSFANNYGRCGSTLANALFGAELPQLAAQVDAAHAARLLYLMSFDYGSQTSLDLVGKVGTTAPSLQLREQAIIRLSYQTISGAGYSPIPVGERSMWVTYFRARFAEVTSYTRFRALWRAVKGLADDGALALAGAKLHVPMAATTQRQVVCEAYALSQARAGSWDEFRQAAQPWSTLAPAAQAVLAAPSGCP